jgi:Kelch motif
MAGTWQQLPSNCTRDIGLTYERCLRFGTITFEQCLLWGLSVINKCVQWADNGYSSCGQWADDGSNHCCTWWPCSWGCKAFYWVSHWVCVFFVWVANLVCILVVLIAFFGCLIFTVVVAIVCLVWAWIEVWFCLSTANGGTALLLTDGTVLMQECQLGQATRRWWRLHPDENGSYFNGLWSRAADSNVARLYFASAVLADGRVIVAGGEFSDASGFTIEDDTNRCEIYDPVADTWTEIDAPESAAGATWSQIGDGASALLADGTFLIGNAIDKQTAIFAPATNAWTAQGDKNQRSSEESWVLLPDDTVITANCHGHPKSEKFVPSNSGWMTDAKLPVDIVEAASFEIGPAVLLPDGSALYVGATGATALYTMPATPTTQGTWTAGATLPTADTSQQGTKDGPGCLLVNGNVLIGIAPVNNVVGDYLSPTTFFEFDGTTISAAGDPPDSDHTPYLGRMLVLPTGDVMYARQDDDKFYAYTGYGTPQETWRPVIQTSPAIIAPGSTIAISGTQFNGLSQAVGYGDDAMAATNYPLVRITNSASGHVRYCRTFDHTTTDASGATVTSMGVATGAKVITTNAEVPADLELGDSDVVVVANGIESLPFKATVGGREPSRAHAADDTSSGISAE